MLLGQVGQDVVDDVVGLLFLEFVGLLRYGAQLLAGAETTGCSDGDARVHATLESGHADHEELIQVRGEDRGEIRALQKGDRLILSQLKHTLVELEPADFAVEIAVLRQGCFRLAVPDRGAAGLFVGLGYVLRDLALE